MNIFSHTPRTIVRSAKTFLLINERCDKGKITTQQVSNIANIYGVADLSGLPTRCSHINFIKSQDHPTV